MGKRVVDSEREMWRKKRDRCLGPRVGDISKGKLLKELVVFSPKQRHFSGVLVTMSSGLRTLPEVGAVTSLRQLLAST